MKCPFCGYIESKVADSRPTEDGSIRRRRECLSCHRRFTTYEVLDNPPLIVVKRDGTRQIFSKEKIINGLVRACEKRPVTFEQINDVAENISQTLRNSLENEISSLSIGELVMDSLKQLDQVAYVRFASVYRQFKDVEEFISELNLLLKK